MRRCLLEDRAHLAILRDPARNAPQQEAPVTGVVLQLEAFPVFMEPEQYEASLAAARHIVKCLLDTTDTPVVGIQEELLILLLAKVEQYVDTHAPSDTASTAPTDISLHISPSVAEPIREIISTYLSVFTALSTKTSLLVAVGIDAISPSSAADSNTQLNDATSILRKLLDVSHRIIRSPHLSWYEPITTALRVIGNLVSHSLAIACFLFDSGIMDAVCALIGTSIYRCFTSVQTEVQWVFSALGYNLKSTEENLDLVDRLDTGPAQPITGDSRQPVRYIDIIVSSASSCILDAAGTRFRENKEKLYDRWYLSIHWFLCCFMTASIADRAELLNHRVIEGIVRSLSADSQDIISIAVVALNQYANIAPPAVKATTLYTSTVLPLLRRGFITIYTAYLSYSSSQNPTQPNTSSIYLTTLKECLIFQNNESCEREIPGMWTLSMAITYSKLLEANHTPTARTAEVLELLLETLGTTISVCSEETLTILCSGKARIFAQLAKILCLYQLYSQVQPFKRKLEANLLMLAEILRIMIEHIPESDREMLRHDIMSAIDRLLVLKLDANCSEILEGIAERLSAEGRDVD